MTTRTTTVRAHLRDFATVALYIAAAASFGTGLALIAEVKAQPTALRLTTEA